MADTETTVTGGAAFKAKLEALAKRVGAGGAVSVGFLEDATYPEGTPVAQVAFWQEFGSTRFQPRPFFRPMIAEKSPGWARALKLNYQITGMNTEQALGRMGQGIKDQLTSSIVNTPQPPLSEITLMLRKMKDDDPQLVVTGRTVAAAAARVARGEQGASGTRAKPLIDTGLMQRAPDFVVDMK